MPARRPANPQGALLFALRTHRGNFKSASAKLAQGATLDGDEKERIKLTLAALGPIGLDAALCQSGWQWLADNGFVFPSSPAAHEEVLGAVLESKPIVLAETWVSRTGLDVTTLPASVFNRTLFRRDTEGLKWWHAHGLPVRNPDPAIGQFPLVLLTLSHHQLKAAPLVTWLLDHGVKPLPRVLPHESTPPLETPLISLARKHRDLANQSAADIQGFRTMWAALIAAGDDPAYRNPLGESPLDLLAQGASANWWEAHQRQEQATDHTPSRPARRRLRP
jgi:hypothetical protein